MNTTRSLTRRTATVTAVATGALLLGAFGANADAGGIDTTRTAVSAPARATADAHNQADVTFAQDMIPHHRQAIVMAEMARNRATSPEVKALAAQIEKAQAPEITTMTGWLIDWGEKVPQGMYGMDGMGRDDGHGMPGMMDDDRMDQMRHARGSGFDTMFLTMMIEHHEGAVEMAETEKKQGAYGPAKELADDIIASQTAEITQMRNMLGTS